MPTGRASSSPMNLPIGWSWARNSWTKPKSLNGRATAPFWVVLPLWKL